MGTPGPAWASRFTGSSWTNRARNHYAARPDGNDRDWWRDFGPQFQGLTPTRLDYTRLKDRSQPFQLHVDLADVPLGHVAGEQIDLPLSMAPLLSELPDLFNLRLGKPDEALVGLCAAIAVAAPAAGVAAAASAADPISDRAPARFCPGRAAGGGASLRLGPFRLSREFAARGT